MTSPRETFRGYTNTPFNFGNWQEMNRLAKNKLRDLRNSPNCREEFEKAIKALGWDSKNRTFPVYGTFA